MALGRSVKVFPGGGNFLIFGRERHFFKVNSTSQWYPTYVEVQGKGYCFMLAHLTPLLVSALSVVLLLLPLSPSDISTQLPQPSNVN